MKLQEREANQQRHTEETVGYVAIEAAGGTNTDIEYEARQPDATVDHTGTRVQFERQVEAPRVLIADMQTQAGANPATLRYDELTQTGVTLRVQEGRSADSETWHIEEEVGYLVFGGTGDLKNSM